MVAITVADGTAVIEIASKILDGKTGELLLKETRAALEHTMHVIIDLTNLRSLDSSGLGVLLRCLREVGVAGGDLKLCCLSPAVRTVFLLVHMHRLFAVYNTREEALRIRAVTEG